MPTYEYRCTACRHGYELFQSMTAPVKRKCPRCGKSKLERLIGTGAGIIFKGGGFYQTDYRSDSYTKAAEADKKSAEPAKESTTAKSDSKSDAATKSDAPVAKESSGPSRKKKKSSK